MAPSAEPDIIGSFYERHPYPPPIEDLAAVGHQWDEQRHRIEHHRLWPNLPYRGDRSILIAGCGTSQAAKYAVRWPKAAVVGIDISRTGVANNRALAEQHDLANLELHELAIEEVATLERQFDLIVCTGVLHHLADPELGLRALGKMMAPDGAMNLMVYGRYGRIGIEIMQRYCRALGIEPSAGDMADLVAALRELPLSHPIRPALSESPDFQDDDALADALFNPRDRSYTVPEVLGLVEKGGLTFSHWFHQAPYLPDCGSLSALAHGSRIAELAPEQQYEAVELFRGTMSRHTVIAHRDQSNTVSFADDVWLDYVPFRPPTAIAVTDRLPPGAAAALLNRAHQDRDLVFFVDQSQYDWFQAVDGRRAVRDIAGHDRDFLERLWRHDLIVIDASGGR